MGRRDTKTRSRFWIPILALSLAIIAPFATVLAEDRHGGEVDLLLVLAVDVSESINQREAWLQRFGHADALIDPRVIAAIESGKLGRIAITYLEWAGPTEQRQVIGWTPIDGMASAKELRAALLAAPVSNGYWTSISAALETASRLIAASPFTTVRRVIDLSSDGRNNAGEPLGSARKRVLDRGITVNGLPVMAMRRNFTWPPMPYLDRYFADCVIGGPGAFSELVENYNDFAQAVRRKLIREIAGFETPDHRIVPAATVSRPYCREDSDLAAPDKS